MRYLLTILLLSGVAYGQTIDTFRVAYVKKIDANTLEIRLKHNGVILHNFYAIAKNGNMQAGDSLYIPRPNNTTRQIKLKHKGKEYIIKPK